MIPSLLIECVRAHPDPDKLRRLARDCSDWNGFLWAAGFQKADALAFWALNEACPDAVPPEILTSLGMSFRQNMERNLLCAKELIRLLNLFRSAGLDAIPLKGPTLSWSLYETPALRFLYDLDFLVEERDMPRFTDLLLSDGCRLDHSAPMRFFSRDGVLGFRTAGEKLSIEIHWLLSPSHFNPLDADEIRARVVTADIAGSQIRVLCPEDLAVYLCVHGAKHGWDGLARLCDLDRLIDRHKLDWDVILSRAEQLRISRILAFGLRLTQDLLGSDLPPEVSRWIRADARAMALAGSSRTQLVERDGISTLRDLMPLWFRLTEGVRRKSLLFWHFLQPSCDDWEFFRLPASMFAFYYIGKPVRLAWKYCVSPIFVRNAELS